MGTIGDICEIHRGELKFEWKINKFLELATKADARYESPEFSFAGINWTIRIYCNGESKSNSVGYVNLYLMPQSLPQSVTLMMSMGLKTADGQSKLDQTSTHLFGENKGFGWNRFVARSRLIERKSELLPNGTLTLICTLSNGELNDGVYQLQEDFRSILENGGLSDVVLKVGGREFKSHRCVLAARSPVFSAMLTHDMKEKNTGVVDIPDADPKIFSDFLNYLYTGRKEIISPRNVAKLYIAADKYQVDKLKKKLP